MYEELRVVADQAARAAGEGLRGKFRSAGLEIEMKARHDFVSSADREAESTILGILGREFPDHRILAEESGRGGGESQYEWIIDPLDGTTNFLEGLPQYGVSIACREREETVVAAIYDPERDDMFSAVRGGGAWFNGEPMKVSDRTGLEGAFLATGYPFKARGALDVYLDVFREVFLRARAIRRCGSAALDLAYTAVGTFDGFFEFRLSAWDIAAGALLIEEAGGSVSDLDGGPIYLESGNVLAGAPGVWRELRDAVALHASENLLDQLAPTDS
jgi:myo-inositol-1(or 4)-monophosphatase